MISFLSFHEWHLLGIKVADLYGRYIKKQDGLEQAGLVRLSIRVISNIIYI